MSSKKGLKGEMDSIEIEQQKLAAVKDAIEAEHARLAQQKERLVAEDTAVRESEAAERDHILSLNRNVQALDALCSRIPLSQNLASEFLLTSQLNRKEINVLENHSKELLPLAGKKIERKQNYIKLISLLLFFSLYATVLILQRQDSPSYEIQSRYSPIIPVLFRCLADIVSVSGPNSKRNYEQHHGEYPNIRSTQQLLEWRRSRIKWTLVYKRRLL